MDGNAAWYNLGRRLSGFVGLVSALCHRCRWRRRYTLSQTEAHDDWGQWVGM